MSMIVEKIPEKIRQYCNSIKKKDKSIGFVPTMGALHEGHLSLVKMSLAKCDETVVSIYVNPSQFGHGEDLNAYPRTLDNDLMLLEKMGISAVFVPGNEQMYKEDHMTSVEVSEITSGLCGKSRPVHFKGVTTVVMKLFNIINPDYAFFGEKDYQQAAVIKKMVQDLNIDVKIITGPIVRESDGLAMSSRNVKLNKKQRGQAPVLYKSLIEAEEMLVSGVSAAEVKQRIADKIKMQSEVLIDYLEIVDPVSLENKIDSKNGILVALAVFFGNTRLIDNILVNKIDNDRNQNEKAG